MGKTLDSLKTIKAGRWILAAALIVFVQLLALCHWGGVKTNFYVDELYSMEHAALFTENVSTAHYFTDDENVKEEQWIPAGPIRENCTATREKSLLREPPLRILKRLVKQRNYNGLLNIAMTFADPTPFNPRGGLVLNLIIFIVLQVSMIGFLRRLHISDPVLLMAITAFGFSSLVTSQAIFIRFYLLTLLYILWIFDLHLIMWQSRRPAVHLAGEAFAFLLMYLAFRNSELVLIVAGSLAIAFSIILLSKKRWRQFAYYFIPLVGGGFWYLKTKASGFLTMLFDFEAAAELPGMRGWVTRKILEATPDGMWKYVRTELAVWIKDELFGARKAMIGLIAVTAAALILARLRRHRRKTGDTFRFIFALAAVAVIYTVFMVISTLGSLDFSARYYSFGLLLIFVIFWYAADRAVRLTEDKRTRQVILLLLAVFMVFGVVSKETKGTYYTLYVSDGPALETARETGLTSVMIDPGPNRCSIYEAVSLAGDDAEICILKEADVLPAVELKDAFLFWGDKETDHRGLREDLRNRGFQTEELGETHTSVIWLCTPASAGE